MSHYDIFRGQLAIKYPSYGHALWEPGPPELYSPVEIGDVGFIREGRFYRLFNALLSTDHPSHMSGVPEHHEPLIPKLANHVIRGTLSPGHYCSAGIDMIALEPDVRALGPDDCPKALFSCKNGRGGAVLSLPVPAHRQDTIAREAFGKWMVTHIDRWFAFARQLELGIEQMEELILVTGCDRARSWTNVAFLKDQLEAQVCLGVEVPHGPEGRISWQVSSEQIRDAVFNQGPNGKNLPEDQCIFIRGFRVARTLGILPKHLRAAANPSTDTDGNYWDSGPELELISVPTVSKDPLYFIFDYVAGRSPDCDMVLVHDVDLARISGICDSNSLEALQPDVVENHLQVSNTEIHTDLYPLSPVKNDDPQTVRVAMLSMITHEPNISPQSPPASLVSENVDLHYLTQCLVINPQGLKGHEDDSNLRGSLVRTDMTGHRYSTPNATSHQVISVDASPAPRTIYLLEFPPELMARILLYLSALDIISCRRTCRILYDLCSDSTFRYLVQLERCAVSDDMSLGLSYPERLSILEKREEAWGMLNFHRSVKVPIPFDQCTHWSFADGALSFGTALDYEDHGSAIGHSYVTLPSLSDAHDQKFEWKSHNFETKVLDVELAVHEHDMMAALIAKEDEHPSYETNGILELRLLSFSTGQLHPLAEKPVIFIGKTILPFNGYWHCEMQIVEDSLILLVSFLEQSMSQDIFFLVRWKTGLTYCLASPEKGSYESFTHISPDTLVIPNLIQNTLEIAKIAIDHDDTPHFVVLCVLHLPPLIQNASLSHAWCRAKPYPTGSGRLVIPSRSDRPFHDKAENAIVIFNLTYSLLGTHVGLVTLIVHRRALLTHIPAAHGACAPSFSTPECTPALVKVPWPIWGPPVTHLFVGNGMHHIATTAGQRAVMLEDHMPARIFVRDFNPYAVRAARALASASGQSQQGNWSKYLPNGNGMSLSVEDGGVSAGSIFTDDVWSSLPYVEIVTQCEYPYDGVMMDDERILGFQTNQNGLPTSFFDVHVLG